VILAVVVLAAAAWAASVPRMDGMDAGPAVEVGSLGWFLLTWLLMMGAMMLPALSPVVAARHASRTTPSSRPRRSLATALFLGSYLAVWLLAGLIAYLALDAARDLAGSVFQWRHGGQWLAVAVLAGAALYQLTATKRRWLARCREPKPQAAGGIAGELRAGGEAGVRCVASSWALMAALFALGVMSLAWMAVVMALIVAERVAPIPTPGRLVAVPVLLALAAGIAAAPARVPAFTVPGSPAAGRAMMRMNPAMMDMKPGAMHMAPATTHMQPAMTHMRPATTHMRPAPAAPAHRPGESGAMGMSP
jgi:predicted metal-binding membrane protein